MEEMAKGIQRVAETSSQAYDLSASTLQEADQGWQLITDSTGQMREVSLTVSALSEAVSKLNSQSEQIGAIVETIQEISRQTNLLALNAAIEASRAGEQGRGFAVVAGEVRKLAASANDSAEQVANLVQAIRSDIAHTSRSMAKGEAEVAAASRSITESGDAFSRILHSTRIIVEQVQEASAAAQQMSASAEEISASIQEMEQISLHTAAAAQTVSAATEEQLASIEEIASSAQKMSDMSAQMKSTAGNFKV